jgi:hypothetical protein
MFENGEKWITAQVEVFGPFGILQATARGAERGACITTASQS